jgi:TP901 family phage tail tape measure protein
METAGLFVTYNVDLSGFTRKVKSAQAAFEKSAEKIQAVADKLSGIGQSLTLGLTAPIALAGASAIKMASDMDESMNKVDVAFKDSAQGVKDFAKTTLASFGISQSAALDTASLYGAMATAMGLTTSEAAEMSKSLTGLSGDLSSFFNFSQEDAKGALGGIFTGEAEPLKKYGVLMQEAQLETFAFSQGLKKSVKELTEVEKVQLRYAYVMSKTANAQGDFARTSDGFANQLRILQGNIQEITTEFGKRLLPTATKIVNKFNEIAMSFSQLSDEQKDTIILFAGIAAAVGPVILALAGTAQAASFVAGGLAILAGPVGLIAAAFAGAAALIIYNWDEVVKFFKSDTASGMFNTIISAGSQLYTALKGLFSELSTVLLSIWGAMESDFSVVTSILTEQTKYAFGNMFAILVTLIRTGSALLSGDWEKAMELLLQITKRVFSGIGTAIISSIQAILKGFSFLANAAGMQMQSIVANSGILALENLKDLIKLDPLDLDPAKNAFNDFKTTIEEINKALGVTDTLTKKVGGTGAAAPKQLEALAPKKADPFSVKTTSLNLPAFKEESGLMEAWYLEHRQKMAANAEALRQTLTSIYTQMSTEIGTALGGMMAGFTSVEDGMKSVFKSLINGMIDAAIAAIIAGEAINKSALGFLAIPLAAGAGAAAKAFFAGVMPFADGGIVSGPTMGLVGEYAGARNNPEVIAPLNKLKSMLGDREEPARIMQDNSNMNVAVTGRLRADGSDLVAIIEEVVKRNDRLYR